METADANLLSPDFWDDSAPNLRLNPRIDFPRGGLDDFLAREPNLRGHVIFATSGSSGAPRLVCLTRAALLASARAVNHHLGAGAEDRWLCALPTFHVGGFGVWARAFAAGGFAENFGDPWDAARFAETCAKLEISLTSLVTTQIFDLVRENLPCPPTLRAIIVGGGALAADLGRRARKLGWPVLQSYGMTEAGSQIATQTPEALDSPFSNADLPILEIWEARTDSEGRLNIRGLPLFSAYLNFAGETWKIARPLDAGGWFATPDFANLTRGRLTPLGRGGRTVKILGELVNLDRLEAILHDLAGESAPHVTLDAVSDDRSGQQLVLVAETCVSANHLQKLRAAFDESAAPFERLSQIIRIAAFPRSPLGKIHRERLQREMRRPEGN